MFHDEFYKCSSLSGTALDAKGYDISEKALRLARENLTLQLKRSEDRSAAHQGDDQARHKSLLQVEFQHFDVLAANAARETMQDVVRGILPSTCDVLISNPPYISRSDYTRTTTRSVRRFEPRLALVPPPSSRKLGSHDNRHDQSGDLFYPHLLDLAERLSAKFVLLEVADLEQAQRVAAMISYRPTWPVHVEIWRDEPSRGGTEEASVNDQAVNVIGEGNGRSVFIWRKDVDALP